MPEKQWDVFISHASEDKAALVKPLAKALRDLGAEVWYDEFTLTVGDSLSRSIDRGLAQARFGVVVLSPAFLAKDWPEYELRGLLARELGRDKVVLPVWYNVSRDDVLRYSPPLADKLALTSAGKSAEELAIRLLEVIRPDIYQEVWNRVGVLDLVRKAPAEKRNSTLNHTGAALTFLALVLAASVAVFLPRGGEGPARSSQEQKLASEETPKTAPGPNSATGGPATPASSEAPDGLPAGSNPKETISTLVNSGSTNPDATTPKSESGLQYDNGIQPQPTVPPQRAALPAAGTDPNSQSEGIAVTFEDPFLPGSAEIRESLAYNLRQLATSLNNYPETDILIVGHTDGMEDPRNSHSLSLERARAVVSFLERQGVAGERMRAAGRGSTEPVERIETNENRAKNRRIEIAIFSPGRSR